MTLPRSFHTVVILNSFKTHMKEAFRILFTFNNEVLHEILLTLIINSRLLLIIAKFIELHSSLLPLSPTPYLPPSPSSLTLTPTLPLFGIFPRSPPSCGSPFGTFPGDNHLSSYCCWRLLTTV